MRFQNKNNLSRIIVVIALIIFLHYTKIISPVESFIIRAINPLLAKFSSVSSDLRQSYKEDLTKDDLIKEAIKLKEEVNKLTAENAKLKTVEDENQTLKKHLNFLTGKDYSYVMANIIFRNNANMASSQYIAIDKGRNSKLREGLVLVDEDGIVAGKIISVKDDLSYICLVNSQDCKFAASIMGSKKTGGVVTGDLGLTIKMEFIPQKEEIKKEDLVTTSSLEKEIPEGLVIGKITEITKESNDLWQRAMIESMIDLDNIDTVSVLLP